MKTMLIATAAAIAAGLGAPAYAADQPTIPVIVKDTTSAYWQIVLAGARQAGKDLGVKVPELGAQSESDINGQISILENAVAEKPAAVVIAPTQFKALGKPVDEAAKKVPIIGIDSAADSKAFTSFLTTDNVQGGRIAADGLAEAITAKYGKAEGDVALITSLPGVGSLDQRAKGFKEELAAKYPGLKLVADKVCRRPGDDRPQHHDRPHHRQSEPARRVRLQSDHGAGREPGDRGKQEGRHDQARRLRQRRQAHRLSEGRHDRRARRPGPLSHGL